MFKVCVSGAKGAPGQVGAPGPQGMPGKSIQFPGVQGQQVLRIFLIRFVRTNIFKVSKLLRLVIL